MTAATVPAPAMPEPGDVVAGRYRVERVLGEGGMGRVFEAHHLVLDQKVALKVLFAEVASRPNVVERFLREAKLTARLRSEHVARVMDAGTSETGLPFLVMECLRGTDLMDLLRQGGRLPWRMVVDVTLQALSAVAHAHAAGIVHRDLKPSNLFLATLEDGTTLVKVLDFGIFKSLGRQGDEVKTLTGQTLMGSPAYMSPEQIRDAKSVDPRSDLWSLGVVMHELMTAELPFRGQGVGELLAAVLEQDPPPLSSKVEGVPEGVEKAVQKALRRQRDYRFASAAEFALELAPFASPRWAELAPRIEETLRGSPFVPTPSAVTALEAGGSGAHGASPETTTQHVDVEPLSVATPAFAMGPPPLPRPLPAAEGAAAVAEPGRGELAATAPRVLAWVRRSPARFAAAWAALMALGAVAVVLVRLLLGAPGAGAPVAAAATVAAMDGPSVTPAPSAEPGPADEAGEAPAAAAEVEGKPAPRAGGGRAPRPSGPAPAPARPKVLRSRD